VARRLRTLGRPGAVVNIITMSSHGGQPFLTGLFRLEGCARDADEEHRARPAPARIRVNGINIGWADTPGEHAIQARDGNPPTGSNAPSPRSPSAG
jgi:NAD(P)-dependent dehydrogenase (short-subunit alcohol dehydrogenase family)